MSFEQIAGSSTQSGDQRYRIVGHLLAAKQEGPEEFQYYVHLLQSTVFHHRRQANVLLRAWWRPLLKRSVDETINWEINAAGAPERYVSVAGCS